MFLFRSFCVARTEYGLGVMNIFEFLSSSLGESEEDHKFILFEVVFVLNVPCLLDGWAAIVRKRTAEYITIITHLIQITDLV